VHSLAKGGKKFLQKEKGKGAKGLNRGGEKDVLKHEVKGNGRWEKKTRAISKGRKIPDYPRGKVAMGEGRGRRRFFIKKREEKSKSVAVPWMGKGRSDTGKGGKKRMPSKQMEAIHVAGRGGKSPSKKGKRRSKFPKST